MNYYASQEGFEPTLDFHRRVNSPDRSTTTATETFAVPTGFEPV